MSRFVFTGFLMMVSFLSAKSQGCLVPNDYSFKSAKDYEEQESAVFECMSWLAGKPLHEDRTVRSQALIYVMLWLSGSPSMTINTYSEFLIFEDECPEMVPELINFLALEMRRKGAKNEKERHSGAIKMLLELYKKSEGLICPSLDYLASKNETDLEIWISDQYKLAVGER